MKSNSLEVKLIEDIQSRALSRINDLKESLNEPNVLDPVLGKNLVDEYLWETDYARKRRNRHNFKDDDDTVYGWIADKLCRAIIEWKEEHKELPLSDLAIWVSYNSRLADVKWLDSKRVLTLDSDRQTASYTCTNLEIDRIRNFSEDRKIIRRSRGLDSIWFELLKEFSLSGKNEYMTPSIHYYLSKFDPHFIGFPDRIRTVAFFSEEPDEDDRSPYGKRHIRQENDILLRNCSVNDLYIKLLYYDDVELVKKEILTRLFSEVEFGTGSEKSEFPPSLDSESIDEWVKRYSAFLRGLILRNDANDLKTLADKEQDKEFQSALLKAIEEEQDLRNTKKLSGQPYRCMTNVYIKVPSSIPSSDGDLGSVIIFSDKVINPTLTRIISSSIWAVFSHLREVEESVISKNTFKKHTSRSAIAAIMGRNMSHNVGSHVLWHLGRDIENQDDCPENTEHFLRYLQQRMDFIAQITTSPVSWCQSLNFKQLMESFDSDQTVLKKNIARSYSEEIKLEFDFTNINEDFDVDIPGGLVGAQAIYSILENIIRNAAKHGDRNQLNNNLLRLELRLENPKENSSSSIKNEWAKKFYRLTIVDNLRTSLDVKEKLEKSLSETMIEDEGNVKSGSWGMKEIKICASYLRRIAQHNIDLDYLKWKPGKDLRHPPIVEIDIESEKRNQGGGLAYSFYLLQPKMAAIVSWTDLETRKNKDSLIEKFRGTGIDVLDEDEFSREFDNVVLRHDFIILPIEFYRENIKKHNRHNELPTRVFLIKSSDISTTAWEDESAVLIQKFELERYIEAPDELKFFLWRKWIEKFYKDYRLFARFNKFSNNRVQFSYLPNGEIKRDQQNSDSRGNQELRSLPLIDFIRETVDYNIDNALFFDHALWLPDSKLSANAVFQESLDDISPARNLVNKISIDLTNIREISSKERLQLALSVFLLKEAAAVTVGILDNRIFRQGEEERGSKGYGFRKFPQSFKLSETWAKRRVYFLDPKLAKENFEQFVANALFPSLGRNSFKKYDFLVLHQGDLDEIQTKMDREKKNFEAVWQNLEKKAKYIIIVTGRGKPQIATDRKLRWVGYSALADELLGKSKIELVEMLYSLRASVRSESI